MEQGSPSGQFGATAKELLDVHGTSQQGYFNFRTTKGENIRVANDRCRPFELGFYVIGPETVTYVVSKDYTELFKAGLSAMEKIRFADDKMKKTYEKCLPTLFEAHETDHAHVLIVKKRDDDVLLRDLKPFLAGDDLGRHAAWIGSRLHEMARYLDYIGVAHNAITPDTVFVSPAGHSIALLGGWFFASPAGASIKALHPAAIDYISSDAFKRKISEARMDIEMGHALVRDVLGDREGTALPKLNAAPAPMIDFLCQPTRGDAQDNLTIWYEQVLPQSYGARRFTPLSVTYSDVYQPGG